MGIVDDRSVGNLVAGIALASTIASVLGCEHKSVELWLILEISMCVTAFLQLLGQSTLNFGDGKKSVKLSPGGWSGSCALSG